MVRTIEIDAPGGSAEAWIAGDSGHGSTMADLPVYDEATTRRHFAARS